MLALGLLLAAPVTRFAGEARVVDGDTLHVGRERVRLFGVDAPELSQKCGASGSSVQCGIMAAAWLRSHAEGGRVECERVDADRYGRTVAICRQRGRDLASGLVAAGWATAYRRYSLRYVAEEQAARSARRGVWATDFEPPAHYRARRREAVAIVPPPNPACPIKGNVSGGGRIYHLPGTAAYAKVRIDVRRGERWFCTVEDAERAGWRRPR